jgi:hypothetical protein
MIEPIFLPSSFWVSLFSSGFTCFQFFSLLAADCNSFLYYSLSPSLWKLGASCSYTQYFLLPEPTLKRWTAWSSHNRTLFLILTPCPWPSARNLFPQTARKQIEPPLLLHRKEDFRRILFSHNQTTKNTMLLSIKKIPKNCLRYRISNEDL